MTKFTFMRIALCLLVWGMGIMPVLALMLSNESILDSQKSVVIKKSSTKIVKDKSLTSFFVDAEQAGEYYLSCWMLGGEYSDGNFSSFDVSVNEKNIGKMIATKSNWQSVRINTETVFLQKGANVISFTTNIPEIPNIEFIKLASTQESATISSLHYDNSLRNIKAACDAVIPKLSPTVIDTVPQNSMPRINLDSKAYYQFTENIPLKYTFHTSCYFTQNQNVTFSVTSVSGSSIILEIFHSARPETYSWSAIAGLNQTKSFTLMIPATGSYKIRARSYLNARDGIANVGINNTTYTGVATYSYGIQYTHGVGQEYNTFTANLKKTSDGEGDPCLFIGVGFPDKIVAYNDDYNKYSDFDWEYNSRINQQFAENTKSIFVNNYLSYNFTGELAHCDLYAGCRSCHIDTLFVNLIHDDVIESAPEDENYTCYSWAGGITSYWEDPTDRYSEYYVKGDELASFDKYLSSARYNGCSIYSREGATVNNSVIDLWGDSTLSKYIYKHLSIKHGADRYAHGYDWECKVGILSRIFHPRYSMLGDAEAEIGGYGELLEYYRFVGTSTSIVSEESPREENDFMYTFEESVADGYSVLEHVQYTDNENSLINAKIREIDISNSQLFSIKYQAWKESCRGRYNSLNLCRNAKYRDLLGFCKSFKNSIFLVYRQLGRGDYFSSLLLSDLTASDALLDNIKKENNANKRDVNGAIIARSPYSNAMKYAKQLINKDYFPQTRSPYTSDNGVRYSNSNDFIAILSKDEISVSFNLHTPSHVSLSVIDLQGRVLNNVLQNVNLEAGEHKYKIEKPTTDICLIRYSLNGNLNIKKLRIK